MREVRRIYADKVRNMCIENDYYTAGSCEEYAEMLNACKVDNPPTEYYQMIAEDIWEHSDQEAFYKSDKYILQARSQPFCSETADSIVIRYRISFQKPFEVDISVAGLFDFA